MKLRTLSIIAAVLLFCNFAFADENSFDPEKFEWGTSSEDVAAAVQCSGNIMNGDSSNENVLIYQSRFCSDIQYHDKTTAIEYTFTDDKLTSVLYMILNLSKEEIEIIYTDIQEKLNTKYVSRSTGDKNFDEAVSPLKKVFDVFDSKKSEIVVAKQKGRVLLQSKKK